MRIPIAGNNIGYARVEFDGDCQNIVDTDEKKQFLNDVRIGMAIHLSLEESAVTNMDAGCGSIIVNFTIEHSNITVLNSSIEKLGQLTTSGNLIIQLTDGSSMKVCLKWFAYNF